ncbi:MAG: phage tail tape measure protein [Candidatus Gastranaerophilales bacterium]|nr:phage tail tape measure protein [Candidatus Gastranaerophilales bacterium]
MGDELKLLVKAVLDTSDTGEISSQLQQIAKTVNSQNVFKVTASLDEAATRSKIESQLKAIARSVNAGSSIKLNFDTSKASTAASDTVRQIRSAVSNAKVMLDVGVDPQALERAKAAFKGLKLDDATVERMSSQLESMRVKVDTIKGSWEKAGDGAERFLRLNITGVNELGQEVGLMQTFNSETGEVNTQLVSVTDNLKKQRAEVAKISSQEQARIKYVEQQTAAAKRLKASYEGTAKPLVDTAYINDADAAYNKLISAIEGVRSASGAATDEQKANIVKLSSELSLLIAKYKDAQYVATQLRTKTVSQVKGEEGVNLTSYEQSLKNAGILTSEFQSKIAGLRTTLNQAFDRTTLTEYLNGFSQLKAEVDAYKLKISDAQALMSQLISLNSQIANQTIRVGKTADGTTQKEEQQAILDRLIQQRTALEGQLTTDQAILDATGKRLAYENSILNAQSKINTAAASQSVKDDTLSANIAKAQIRIENLRKTYSAFTTDPSLTVEWNNLFDSSKIVQTQEELTNLNAKVGLFEQKLIQAGKHGSTVFGELANNVKKMASWMILGGVIAGLVRGIKGIETAVVELDTAMTELKKVTDETNSSYSAFLDTAAEKSIEIGTTYVDFVKSTSDFARLGYTLKDSTSLAEAANIYNVVGDDIENIDQATTSLISTMKAFGIESSDAMSIIDKFNEVGNRFAISSGGIGDAMQRSASALAEAGNTIDEAIALFVAANNVVKLCH